MAGLSERKQNSLYGTDEKANRSNIEDGHNDLQTSRLPGSESGQEGVPQLEGILDKISTIMTEPSASQTEGLERVDRRLLEPDTNTTPQETYSQLQETPEQGGFVPSEPINLLAPYSEVLNDVRDYFKEKHSLDPNEGLLEEGGNTLFQGQAVSQSETKRDEVSQTVEGNGIGDRLNSNSHDLNSRDEIFSPVKFEQALGEPSRRELTPLSQDGANLGPDVVAFRRELMDRIGQMEQVIGHHFGNQKSLAQDAAKAAVSLTLDAIEETPIGHRLAELETSLADLKSALNQAGGIQALADQQSRLEPKPDNSQLPHIDGSDADRSKGVLPPPLHTVSEHKADNTMQEEAVTFGCAVGDVNSDRAMEPSETKLKDLMSRKQEDQALVHHVDQMAAEEKNKDKKPIDQRLDQDKLDPFLSKSSDLRAQFNRSKIVSNDDDLQTLQPKGARPAFIIITIAFLLAAIGISLGNQPLSEFSFQGLVKKISVWKDSALDKGEPSSKGDKSLVEEGAVKAQKEKAQVLIKDGDVSITGNINPRGEINTKINRRLSHTENDKRDGFEIDPETLLPSVSGKLSLPPALIGPYSLRHSAANGDASAQYEVARRFGLGQGVEQDFEKAVMWYMQAAAQGFAPAQYRLATLYERGRGVEKSLQRAQVWYQRAAQLGNIKAMHNLAVVSTALDRNNPDYQAAVYWFKQAASRNLADSQFNLAILYQNGVGVPQNLVEAYRWFSLAARQGDLDAARRRDLLEKKIKKTDLLLAHNMLQAWKPIAVKTEANEVGLNGLHVTSTMSHADETVQRSRVLTAQVLLRKLGYDLKEVDGTLNDRTIAAIKKFEKDKGLPITGKVDHDLIKILNKVAL